MKPIRRDSRLEPGPGLAWFFKDQRDPAPRIASQWPPLASTSSFYAYDAMSWRQLGKRSIEVRRIRLIGAALIASLTAMAFRASASLTGDYTKFQHCPISDSEVDLSVEATVRGRTSNNQNTLNQQVRELFKTLFTGLNCYIGSITNTVRRAITLKSTNQADHLLSLNNNSQTITELRNIESDRIGNALATTRTNALRTLTFSPA
jgi:hypothetical protein